MYRSVERSVNRPTTGFAAGALFQLMRPRQWVKNLFLFAPLVFARQLFTPELIPAIAGCLAFSMASSCVYIMNDIVDAERDQLHPKKCFRPIPSGRVPKPVAWVLFAALMAAWIPVSLGLSPIFGAVTGTYFLMNVAYSAKLKHVFLLDVMVIAIGFVLRVVAGAVLVRVPVSQWLFVCTILLALFLGFAKRRSELQTAQKAHRKVLEQYSIALIDQFLSGLTGAAIMAYALYSAAAAKDQYMMLTVPFVVYGLFRYLYLINQGDLTGAPEEVLLRDVPMIVNMALWGLSVVVILYVHLL